MNRFVLVILFLALSVPDASFAVVQANSQKSVRRVKSKPGFSRLWQRWGAYVSALGDPYPSFGTGGLVVNATEFLRVSAGFGWSQGTATGGAGLQAESTSHRSQVTLANYGVATRFLLPGKRFSPFAGLGFSHIEYSRDGVFSGVSLLGLVPT